MIPNICSMIVYDKRFSRIVFSDLTNRAVTRMKVDDIEVPNIFNDKGKKLRGDFHPIRSIGDVPKGIMSFRSVNISVHAIDFVCPLGESASYPCRVKDMEDARM